MKTSLELDENSIQVVYSEMNRLKIVDQFYAGSVPDDPEQYRDMMFTIHQDEDKADKATADYFAEKMLQECLR